MSLKYCCVLRYGGYILQTSYFNLTIAVIKPFIFYICYVFCTFLFTLTVSLLAAGLQYILYFELFYIFIYYWHCVDVLLNTKKE